MEKNAHNRWVWPPLDQWLMGWGLFPLFVLGSVCGFLVRLSGAALLWTCALAMILATTGAVLLFCAKRPLYRQGRFFTWGSGSLPEAQRRCYRWSYGCLITGLGLLVCLLGPRL